ncbi:hypothetical protein [Pantoea allii]|uniref:hypothetical protein n=1 Tax=Pantoea allii TaxID=574096 RepID=UPI0024B82B92|nr:hypothetical protein [Pantoea allii]MDJ0087662.1 hypothetical protein [Pantoea allii]
MTTNSPNPVDGDVQALIAFLKEKVASLKLAVKQRAFENVRDELVMDLKSAEISLAALTAEPVGEVVDVGGSRMVEWDRCISEGAKVYTTPPAQLLRPVELPHAYSPALSSVMKNATDGRAVMRCDKSGKWINKTAVIEALRQHGIEVKS